jgi:hypothetical protein
MFAGVLLLIAGTLNIVYGIGALDSANIFANEKRYILTNLNTGGSSGSSAAASARSALCSRSATPTRGGRWRSSSCRSGSSTASSSSATRSAAR